MKTQIMININYELDESSHEEVQNLIHGTIRDIQYHGKLSGDLDAYVQAWNFTAKHEYENRTDTYSYHGWGNIDE